MKCRIVLIITMGLLTFSACATQSLKETEVMYRIPVPMSRSVIEFPFRNFQVETVDESIPWYFFVDKKSGLAVSFNLEPTRKCFNSESCRDYLADNKIPKSDDLVTWYKSQVGQVYLFEWMMGPVRGLDLRQHHMHANYMIDSVWIDVHLSKVFYKEEDRDIFLDFVKSIEIK